MSTAKFDTLQNVAGSKSVPVSTVVDGSAKAWVNFNGTGTVAIRASGNVSSITDNGVGDYTVNFTSALADANYAVSGVTSYIGGSQAGPIMGDNSAITARTTTSYRFGCLTVSPLAEHDPVHANVTVFR